MPHRISKQTVLCSSSSALKLSDCVALQGCHEDLNRRIPRFVLAAALQDASRVTKLEVRLDECTWGRIS